ncbi:putative reverse transcriptase domain-containing protein [Tanacetum coccineum]
MTHLEEDPSRDDSFDASAGTDESPPAQVVPVSAPQSPPSLSAPIAPYRALETMQGPRKTFRPQPRLSLTTRAAIVKWATAPPSPSPTPSPLSPLASSSPPPSSDCFGPSRKRSHPSPSPYIGPSRRRCRSPSQVAPALAELALAAPALPSIPIDLLPPRKRFGAIERIETAEREIESLRARLVASEIQIVAHQSKDIGRDIRVVGRMHTTRQMMSFEAIEELIDQRVADVLLTYEINRNTRNGNGNGSHDVGSGNTRTVHTARGCMYKEFLNCQSLNFKGTEEAVKYATCTLLNGALTWWNSHVETVGIDPAYEMSWKDLMKMMTDVYFPRNKIHKLENELWNLTVKGIDVAGYTQRFQELALLYPKMVPTEKGKIERYIWGLPDSIQGNVTSAGPARLQDAIKLANRRYRGKCPKLKNQNRRNPAGNGEAQGRVHALGGGKANQDPNIVTGTFLFNNHYAAILFDTCADRSFVSTAFSSLIDIAPSALDIKYDIELADGKTIGF